jgi:hypothetical protein
MKDYEIGDVHRKTRNSGSCAQALAEVETGALRPPEFALMFENE